MIVSMFASASATVSKDLKQSNSFQKTAIMMDGNNTEHFTGPGTCTSATSNSRSVKSFEDNYIHRSFNYVSILTDEIALEGLDGITLQALWLRLEHRPDFSLSLNENSKNTFWESLKRNRLVQFYDLPVQRPDLVHYDRMEFSNERGNTYEPLSAPEDIYSYAPIEDVAKGVRGSCPYYKERREIGVFVRKLKLDHVMEVYGNKLVIVAHQGLRDKILFHNTFMESKELTILQYCILERVGRARYHGESTRGNISLSVMKIDAKTLFYHRKVLISKQLITKQAFSMKFGPNRLSSLITIFHLPRFYVLYKNNQVRNVERLFNELLRSPDYRRDLAYLKHQYGKNCISLAMEDYSDIFDVQDEAREILYPEKLLELKNPSKADRFGKRQLKVLKLKDPYINFTTYLTQRASAKEDEEDPESSEKDIFVLDEIKCQTSALINCWKYFIQKYADGCTFAEIIEQFNMYTLDARAVTRLALKFNFVVSFVEDAKKTKFQKYVYFKCSEANQIIRHLTSSLPVGKVVGTGAGTDYNALGRVKFNPADLQQEQQDPSSHSLTPLVEISELPLISTSSSNIENEPDISDVILPAPLEDNILHQGPLLQEEGAKTTARSTVSEEYTFVPVKYIDTHDEQGMLTSRYEASPFEYQGLFGFQVLVQVAGVNSKVIKGSSFLVNSLKTVRRVKYILDTIASSKFIAGSSRLLQEIRLHEAEADTNSEIKMDRISLYRILKELHKEKRIQIWRITLSLDKVHKVVTGFTLGDTCINSPHLLESINSLIRWLHAKFVRPNRRLLKTLTSQKILRRKQRPTRPKIVKPESGKVRKKKRVGRIMAPSLQRYSWSTQSMAELRKSGVLWDDGDTEARARSRRQRSFWTPIEDASLMYVFIASVLFFPRYKLGRLVIYNSRQLRDVLHLKIKEAKSKTTVALRRRFHFLMRKPDMYARLRHNLSAAIEDRDLKIYIKDKYEPAALSAFNQTFAQVSVEGLSEVFDYLRQKFDLGFVQRPNPILSYADTVPESRKRKAANEDGFKSKKSKYSEMADPLDIRGFEMSTTEEDYAPLEFAAPTVSMSSKILESNRDAQSRFHIKLITGKTILFSLLFSGHPSEVVIEIVDRMDDTVLTKAIDYLRERTIISVTKSVRFTLALPMKRRLQTFLTPPMYNYASCIVKKLQETLVFNSSKVATFSSFYCLTEICAHEFSASNAFEIHVDMPVNIIDFNKEWKGIMKPPPSSQKRDLPEVPSSTSTSFEAPGGGDNFEDLDDVDDSNIYELNLRDYKSHLMRSIGLPSDQVANAAIFNLNLPHLNVTLKNRGYQFESELPRGTNLIALMRGHLFDSVPTPAEVADISIPTEFQSIARTIYSTRENGMMILTLKNRASEMLRRALDYLYSMKLVFLVGNDFCRLVGIPFVKLWSSVPLNAIGLQPKGRRTITRSWVTGTGEINWQVVDQLLCSLIGYMELQPGSTVRQVASSLVPLISTVEGVILLKLLHRLNLVSVFRLTGSGLPRALFEERAKFSLDPVIEDHHAYTLEFETLVVEVTEFYTMKYCILKLRLEEQLGKGAFSVKNSTSFTSIDPKRKYSPPNTKKMRKENSEPPTVL